MPGEVLSHVGTISERCTAVLAPPNVVFAGHCGQNHEIFVASAGSRLQLSGCRVHPDAAPGNGLDIGSCVISKEAASGPATVDVPALTAASPPAIGTRVTFAGLGNVLVGA